jgi:hypothetical protein
MVCFDWLTWVTHGFWGWLAGGDWRPSFDGTAAIVAGIIGFVAIIRQTRSSERSVTQQLKESRQARKEEEDIHARAVAKALLYEIDDFYRYHVVGIKDWISADPKTAEVGKLPVGRVPSESSFIVFSGNAGEVGKLRDDLVRLVVKFYGAAESLRISLKVYDENLTRAISIRGLRVQGNQTALRLSDPVIQEIQTADTAERLARFHLSAVQMALPGIKELTYLTCYELCQDSKVSFDPAVISVAVEKLSVEGVRSKLIPNPKECDAQTH